MDDIAAEAFARLEAVQDRIRELKEEEEELTALLWDKFGASEQHAGHYVAEIKQPVKFSKDAAMKVLALDPVTLKKVLVESWTIPAAKAKEVLTPEQLQQCYVKNGKPQIKFKEVEDDE